MLEEFWSDFWFVVVLFVLIVLGGGITFARKK